MTTLSIGKTIAPALLVGTVSVAAIVYGVTVIPHGAKVESGAVGVMSQPSQPESGTKSAPLTSSAITPERGTPTGEAPTALASTQSKVADLSAALGTSPPAPAADPSLPAFDVARVETGGDAVIAGRAAPGATVELMRNGERLDQAVADASGQFVMVPPHLPAGSYELSLSAKLADGTVALSKQGVTVTIKEADATGSIAPPQAQNAPAQQTAAAASPAAKPEEAAAQPQQAMASTSVPGEGAPPHESDARNSTRIVVRGDSLWRISRVTYGAGERYAILYRANRGQIRDPNLIHPGQVLVLPVKRR